MAVSTISTIRSTLYYQQKDTQNLAVVNNTIQGGSETILYPGSGDSQVDQAFFYQDVMETGESIELDLLQLTQELFDTEISIAFRNVKAITICNKSTVEGETITLSVSSENSFSNLLDDYTGRFNIYAGSSMTFSRPISGWPVGSSQRYLTLHDEFSYGPEFSVTIVGNK